MLGYDILQPRTLLSLPAEHIPGGDSGCVHTSCLLHRTACGQRVSLPKIQFLSFTEGNSITQFLLVYSVLTILQAAALIVASPLGVLVLSTALYSHMSGGTTLSNLTFAQVLTDVHDSLIYGLVDHFVFNNFTFDLVSLVLYPVWLMMWSVIWMNT